VKVGGAQGSHGVRTAAGKQYTFSQWGCGTFEGVRTHISPQLVVSPEALLMEADELRQLGVADPFALLTIDERALCATEYHGIASRLRELARKRNARGTIGTGMGEAYRDATRVPELTIRAGDLAAPDLRDRLAAVRAHQRAALTEVIAGGFLPADQAIADEEIQYLNNDRFLDHHVRRFQEVARRANITGSEYLGREILARDGVVVVESSHGVLTDNLYGFHPHTSAIRTLPKFFRTMIEEAGYDGAIVTLGVTRAYAIRHGAGPMPTHDAAVSEALLPGSHKETNRWQGAVRVGALDTVLLRYALSAAGGADAFTGLAMTWFDQMQTNGAWYICDGYERGAEDQTYFTPNGDIRLVHHKTMAAQYEHQHRLGELLQACVPRVTRVPLPLHASRTQLYSVCATEIEKRLGVPVRMVSFGPTERDKLCQ